MNSATRLTLEQELEIFKDGPEPQVCLLLAKRVRELRSATGESQAAFAQRAGISVRTYKRFELEGHANLENFIQILRALDRTRYLPSLFVQPSKTIRPPSINERIEKILTRDPKEVLRRAYDLDKPISRADSDDQ
ncbi:helix-turn-helix domain-containing protein [Azohydromonas lata]|jgi:transcriptional regulator with XRE-family HTH domain|uniref:helix-turn-helix domain-containing protein n=1 Tax=Azohydromonas lata TaxID=45677 RepID=UPI0012F4B5DD|nr:helix-turn-helix transcriptional regulator [Azohydromonas lata]